MAKERYIPGNETYTRRISSPMLRLGIEIETEVSGKYLVKTMKYLFQEVREFNDQEKSRLERKAEETGR